MDAEKQSRKRGALLNYDKCVICQEDNKLHKLVTPTSDGLKTIQHATEIRLKLRNDNFRSATDCLANKVFTSSPPSPSIVCHNGCRASYTSAHNLDKLKTADISLTDNHPTSSAQSTEIETSTFLQSKITPINWDTYIFCQQESKEKWHLIQTKQVSKRILESAKYDPILRQRLACVNDLIAADG